MMTQSSATQRGSEPADVQFNTDRTHAGRWTITFSNPPINMFVPTTIVELGALMTDLEADPSVKVVVFQSANPDFFIAHLDVAKAAERPEVLGLWRDFVLRLSSAPVVSIAKIRGRTRGIGNEFVLACDMRFASRQSALFGNPEVGVGLVPGGGALEWLPRLVGRSRALEIVLSGDDFDADIAERYGWVNRTLDDANLDSFVDALVRRLASFDRETLGAAKAQINRFGTPTAAEIQSSNDLFFPLLALPGAQARRAKIRDIGYGVPSDFELNFGRYLPALGRADDDDTDKAVGGDKGELLIEGDTGKVHSKSSIRAFVGIAPDMFAVDTVAFHNLQNAFYKEHRYDGDSFLRHRQNFFNNRNVTAIVLEVPNYLIGKGTVHAWATVSLYGHAPEMQVSRWGLPLITHLFLNDPGNQEVKETYNKSVPSDDIALLSGYIADFTHKMATYAGSVMNPEEYGKQTASRLCPITLPYELGPAAAFDLAGFNGRPLGDDVVDVMLTLASNKSLQGGVAPDRNRIRTEFPYFGEPYSKEEQKNVVPWHPRTSR
jgi:enoyl-CoA hydratase/carnithine racemase